MAIDKIELGPKEQRYQPEASDSQSLHDAPDKSLGEGGEAHKSLKSLIQSQVLSIPGLEIEVDNNERSQTASSKAGDLAIEFG
mmetsp:Transcript_47465/g.62795  ORF Transcript_47465/g.62795 Transcript_47465/m.62795 type:complete len:83 (-) Transcript_47465:393-641(-)|eukprot:CAMPEP_0185570694 /NCGR_PEP_ID=MMETSP0434-20130131/2917_1 /TAXON_ID=626734 ORGANISM="Favella taraikaensis, Strain Fe Narragansett Bay" /NCGR_SAMPLE_ID=MMETSP0434 /ASSEMBLY_ACC=CAM_ASM_000379 /LENGTH=82 /DNA_ID=CAMNT_0028185889 /DNA_START=1863 /DNA_END=2111 /DNA_ORIENTATION=-